MSKVSLHRIFPKLIQRLLVKRQKDRAEERLVEIENKIHSSQGQIRRSREFMSDYKTTLNTYIGAVEEAKYWCDRGEGHVVVHFNDISITHREALINYRKIRNDYIAENESRLGKEEKILDNEWKLYADRRLLENRIAEVKKKYDRYGLYLDVIKNAEAVDKRHSEEKRAARDKEDRKYSSAKEDRRYGVEPRRRY